MSKELKVGILSLVTIAIFIFGFKFLKGQKFWRTQDTFYAVYDKVDGLYESDPVLLNGFQVGKVSTLTLMPKSQKVMATITIDEDIQIPHNSTAILYQTDLLGDKSINLIYGSSSENYKSGDTINTSIKKELLEQLGTQITPLTDKMDGVILSLDSVLKGINVLFDQKNENSIFKTVENVNDVLKNLETTTDGLNDIIKNDKSDLNKSLENIQSFTANLDENSEQIENILENFSSLSDTLAELNIGQLVSSAESALNEINDLMASINEGDGTINSLLNDPEMYNNLEAASKNLDNLLIDIREHPGRYVHLSVFGRKDPAARESEKAAKKAAKNSGK